MNSSRRSFRSRAALMALFALTATNVTAGVAQAQDAPKRPYEFAGDFSLAASQGNQQVTTIALGQRYSYKFAHWKFSQSAAALRGTANGVRNAELYQLAVRSDYDITKKLTAYLSASGLRNTPAGLNSQVQEGVGLGYQFVDTERDKLQFSLGLGALQRSFVGDAASQNDFVGNASGNYRHLFSKTAYLEQTATFTPNFTTSDAWLLTAKSAVVAPLSARFGIKVGYLVNFNNAPPLLPPVNGVAQTVRFKKFDGLLTTGVQFTY
jgi:putative salt-induced outer membrane protein